MAILSVQLHITCVLKSLSVLLNQAFFTFLAIIFTRSLPTMIHLLFTVGNSFTRLFLYPTKHKRATEVLSGTRAFSFSSWKSPSLTFSWEINSFSVYHTTVIYIYICVWVCVWVCVCVCVHTLHFLYFRWRLFVGTWMLENLCLYLWIKMDSFFVTCLLLFLLPCSRLQIYFKVMRISA